jgi:hypothetical protein
MKIAVLLSGILIYSVLTAFGQQDQLVLKKKSREKEKVFTEGKTLKVITTNNRVLKGKFEAVNDSLLAINQDTIVLSDIAKIRTKSPGGKITGAILSGGGGLITVSGLLLIVTTFAEGGLAPIVGVFIGIPLTVVGILITTSGVLFLTIGKKYKREKWDYRIVLK